MKKEYISPAIISRRIKLPRLLAGSGTMGVDGNTTITDETQQKAKDNTGFDWGDSWSNNEEPEN